MGSNSTASGFKKCPYCAEDIPVNASICSFCGERQSSQQPSNVPITGNVPPLPISPVYRQPIVQQPPIKSFSRILLFVAIVIVAVVVLAVAGYFLFIKKGEGGLASSYRPPTKWTKIASERKDGITVNLEARAVPEHDKGSRQAIEVRARIADDNPLAATLGNAFLDKFSVAYLVDCNKKKVDEVAVLLFQNNQSEKPVWKATQSKPAPLEDKRKLLKFACGGGVDDYAPATPPKKEDLASEAPAAAAPKEREVPAVVKPAANPLVGDYSTDRHNIRLSQNSNGYLYQSWNAPHGIGDGHPDFQLSSGSLQLVGTGDCVRNVIRFKTGDTAFEIGEVKGFPSYCFDRSPPTNADTELTVLIRGRQKDHYWMYKN